MTGYPVVKYTDYFVKIPAPLYVCGAIVLYIFALSSNRCKERRYHIIGYQERPIIIAFGSTTRFKYAGLCILLCGNYVTGLVGLHLVNLRCSKIDRFMTDLIRNQQSLPVLGVNGFGTFAGVVGSLYKKKDIVQTVASRYKLSSPSLQHG